MDPESLCIAMTIQMLNADCVPTEYILSNLYANPKMSH